jgi:hypothetical protein
MFFLEKGVCAIDDARKLISPDVVLICSHTLAEGWGMSMGMIADDGRRLHLSAAVLVLVAFFLSLSTTFGHSGAMALPG